MISMNGLPAWDADSTAARESIYGQRVAVLASSPPAGALEQLDQAAIHWQLVHPRSKKSREKVAMHESGHFIACEAEGLGGAQAEIHAVPSQTGWNGWAGSMRPLRRTNWLAGSVCFTSGDLRADAVSTLAGPAAEAMFAGGDFLASFVEIMTVAVMAARLADIEEVSFAAALADVASRTARLLQFHRCSVTTIAARLSQRKRVSRCEQKVARVLAAVQAFPPYRLPPAPEQEAELARWVASAPVDLAALARRVAR